MHVKLTKKHIVLRLTPNQALALASVVTQANGDGDHEEWLRSCDSSAAEIRALRDVMQIVAEARSAAHSIQMLNV